MDIIYTCFSKPQKICLIAAWSPQAWSEGWKARHLRKARVGLVAHEIQFLQYQAMWFPRSGGVSPTNHLDTNLFHHETALENGHCEVGSKVYKPHGATNNQSYRKTIIMTEKRTRTRTEGWGLRDEGWWWWWWWWVTIHMNMLYCNRNNNDDDKQSKIPATLHMKYVYIYTRIYIVMRCTPWRTSDFSSAPNRGTQIPKTRMASARPGTGSLLDFSAAHQLRIIKSLA